jgi:3-methyladenine DNA glycosylase/8-oxoguanine DNA glycosylase
MVNLLCHRFGEILQFDDQEIVISPKPSRIARLSEDTLKRACKLGFRASTLKACAEAIIKKEVPDLRTLAALPAGDARRLLKRIKGLGDYSLDVIGVSPSFPVDSWSWKIFAAVFKLEGLWGDKAIRGVRSFAVESFGPWQHYVYAYVLNDLPKLSARFGIEA